MSLADILRAAPPAFTFAKETDREWVFGKTAQTLYPSFADQPPTSEAP